MSAVPQIESGAEVGSAFQYQVPAAVHALASSIPLSSNVASQVLPSGGFQKIAVGVTSTQAGQIQIQRYLDLAGTIPQGPAITAALTAATAGVANVTDGAPFQSFKVTITNSSGTTVATLSNLAILQQSA